MTTPAPLLLIVEDDPQMRRMLIAALRPHGYRIAEAASARDALSQALGRNPDVILLDLGLPDGDGLEVTRALRQRSRVPIIVLSARGQDRDKVSALDMGADDYLTKPFSINELLARIRVALRHSTAPLAASIDEFEAGEVRVDLALRRVFVRGEEVHLTPTEYKLLTTLIRHAGRVMTHRQLLEAVWGQHSVEQTHYLRVYMAQLRHKLEVDAARPRLLMTESGVGYRLRDD